MDMLFLASITLVVLLYGPGFLFFKALRFSPVSSLVMAPIASIGAYAVLPIIYDKAGIYCTVYNVVLAPTVIFGIAFLITWALARKQKSGSHIKESSKCDEKQDWLILGLYVVCGLAVCLFAFIANLGAPDAFFSRYDNQTHLGLAQSFVDSGTWSALHYSRYGTADPSQIPFTSSSGGFYPVAWHILVALSCLISGAKVTVASNALVVVVSALVFPAGMFALMRVLFPENRTALIAGAFSTVAFASYPWVFPLKGPTFPNMLGSALMPAALATTMYFLENKLVRKHVLQLILFAAISFVSLALAHTSALFAAFIFLAAYGGHYLNKLIKTSQSVPNDKRTLIRVIVLAAYILAIIGFWAFCLNSPIFSVVLSYEHIEDHNPLVTVVNIVLLRFGECTAQYALAFVSIIGIVACIRRRILWLLIPVAYMCIGFFVSRTGIEPFLTIFMGLWYKLPYRASSCLSVYLMPVAALGLSVIWQWITNFCKNRADKLGKIGTQPAWAGGIVMALLAVATFAPICIPIAGHDLQTPYNSIYKSLNETYAQDENRVYGAEEVAFVDKVMDTIPEGALVINSPQDGSVFSYGVNHLNAYYRSISLKRQTDTSNVIRAHLDEYASNSKVRKAVQETGAQYVLQLDSGVSYEDLVKLPQYYEKNRDKWAGIDRIREDTPGFSVVLSDGDMRLYRIDETVGA